MPAATANTPVQVYDAKPRYRPHVDYDAPRPGYVLSGPRRRFAEGLQYWVLPFLGWPAGWLLWRGLGYDATAVTAAMLVPVAFMTVVVYWGTQLRERWTFPVAYAPRGYLPQIGIIYAATLHLCYLACSPLLGVTESVLANAALFTLAGGLLGGLAGCTFDYFAIRHDILRVFVGRYRRGEPPARVVAAYGPKFFTSVAAVFAAVTAAALLGWG